MQEDEELRERREVEEEGKKNQQAWRETFASLDQEKHDKRQLEEELMKQLVCVHKLPPDFLHLAMSGTFARAKLNKGACDDIGKRLCYYI